MSSCPLAKYSPIKTLHTTSQRSVAVKLFPCHCSGNSKDGCGVPEFHDRGSGNLQSIRAEFLEMLKLSTAGKAHLLLLEWITYCDSIRSILYQFGGHFDK
jgi:hypothetical protein